MPLYFGLLVCCDEAFRIFDLDLEYYIDKVIEEKNMRREQVFYLYLIEYVRKYLKKNNTKIEIHSTDKGQYIIGYEIKEVSDISNSFINVDEFVDLLVKLKIQFSYEMNELNAKWSNITLERLEGDELKVIDPIPYIIEYN